MELEAKECKWGTCSDCINREDGVCYNCPDENGLVGHCTECSPRGTCENWKERKSRNASDIEVGKLNKMASLMLNRAVWIRDWKFFYNTCTFESGRIAITENALHDFVVRRIE